MENPQLPLVALTLGDPAGIGPEIVLKSLADQSVTARCRIWLCASLAVVRSTARLLGQNLVTAAAPDPDGLFAQNGVGAAWQCHGPGGSFLVLEPGPAHLEHLAAQGIAFPAELRELASRLQSGAVPLVAGTVGAGQGLLAFSYIALAARLCQDTRTGCRVMATAPVHKEALQAAQVPFIGHTEILGGLAGVANPLTMFETRGLRIFFHSRHVSLRKACDLITRDRVLDSLRRCHEAMAGLGLPSRHIAVAGLNPHCGEHGLFGTEDDEAVAPAVADARAEGIHASGPIGADSVFFQARTGGFDAVLSLYHDQGHIAAKTWDFDRTISVTLGLPYLRTSVDHGTAMDIAGTGVAREISMTEAIRVAIGYATV